MIDQKYLEETAVKLQTTAFNLTREYLQHRFLASLYQKENSRLFFFKGGTAFRVVFQSSRFSEDLDFSIIGLSLKQIEDLLEEVLVELERENLKVDISEAKATTGGYFFTSKTNIFNFEVLITLNLIIKKGKIFGDTVLVNSPICPSYTLQILKIDDLLKEKFRAALTRKKSRDFFDLYFILRSQNLRSFLEIGKEERSEIKAILRNLDKKKIEKDLKPLLPKSFQPIVNNIPELLLKELG